MCYQQSPQGRQTLPTISLSNVKKGGQNTTVVLTLSNATPTQSLSFQTVTLFLGPSFTIAANAIINLPFPVKLLYPHDTFFFLSN